MRLVSERFVRVLPQQFVQVSVGPDNRKRSDLFRKNDFVSFSTKFDVARKKQLVFRRRVVAKMPYRQFSRRKSVVRQLSADAYQCSQPKLYLMPIRTSIYVQVVKRDNSGPI